MTDRKRALQEAWRALAGWQPNMAYQYGAAGRGSTGLRCFRIPPNALPDLDAPANHGCWIRFVLHEYAVAMKGGVCQGPLVELADGQYCHPSPVFAAALLGAYCRAHDAASVVGDDPRPPEVLAWWKLEQEMSMPVEPSYGCGEASDG